VLGPGGRAQKHDPSRLHEEHAKIAVPASIPLGEMDTESECHSGRRKAERERPRGSSGYPDSPIAVRAGHARPVAATRRRISGVQLHDIH
jgi:hypothetical protein